jgi:DNA-binding transcriptional MerR regulator
MFDVTDQTVKAWSAEFAPYLSPTAIPDKGRKRRFTRTDVEVFALVAEQRHRAQSFEEIHAALRANQRGDVPAIADELAVVNPATMIVTLKNQVQALQMQIVHLQAGKSEAEGQVKLLKEQLTDKERQVRELLEETARLKAAEKDKKER